MHLCSCYCFCPKQTYSFLSGRGNSPSYSKFSRLVVLKNIIFYLLGLAIVSWILIQMPLYFEDFVIEKDVLVGIISALLLLIVIELKDIFRDRTDYGYLRGKYKRKSFHSTDNGKTVDTKYEEVPAVPSDLELKYKGSRRYEIPKVTYPEGNVKASIFIDTSNRKLGSGIYQYTSKFDGPVDFGTYIMYVDELDHRILYVFHKNILPSGIAVGYEVWVKQ